MTENKQNSNIKNIVLSDLAEANKSKIMSYLIDKDLTMTQD
jgi:hypothetical protein